MTWHLHYNNLIHHKIFKLLILAYFFNLIIWFGLRSIQNNIFIQNTRSLYRIFITAWYHLSKNQQIHMNITAQHHFSSHSINSLKKRQVTRKQHSQDNSTNSQPNSLSLSFSTLWFSIAASGSWNFSFKSSSSLCWSSFSRFAAEPAHG